MFVPPDWTHAEFVEVTEALRGAHVANYYATLLTLEDEHVVRLPQIMAGSTVDHIVPGQSAKIVVADPNRELINYQGANARQYLCRVFAEVQGHDPWPVGTFAINQASWSADGTMTFECVSKAMLAQYRPLDPFTVKAGTKITDAIRLIMAEAGEADRLMSIPDLAKTLKHDVTVAPSAPDDDPDTAPRTFMVVAKELADGMGYDLFYRPDGSLMMRKPSTKAVMTFRDGQNGWITADGAPRGQADYGSFHNVVIGLWGKDLGEKPVRVVPPDGHKLSPGKLKRRGHRYTQALIRKFPNERKEHEVERQCKETLKRELSEAISEQAAIFPFPFLEPGDYVAISTDLYHNHGFEPSWTLTLEMGAAMTLGWNQFAFLGPLQ